jgi:hypothetical protein
MLTFRSTDFYGEYESIAPAPQPKTPPNRKSPHAVHAPANPKS